MKDDTNWKGTYTRNGVVNATNLTCYFHPNPDYKCIPQQDFLLGLAHAYGESPSMPRKGSYDQIDDVVKSTDNYGYFCRNTPGECAYRFVEYNPDDHQKTYPLFTDWTITASPGQWSTYWQTEKATPTNDTSGISDGLRFKIFNGSDHDSIIIPQEFTGANATTYIYRGVKTPQKATKFSCGDRCIYLPTLQAKFFTVEEDTKKRSSERLMSFVLEYKYLFRNSHYKPHPLKNSLAEVKNRIIGLPFITKTGWLATHSKKLTCKMSAVFRNHHQGANFFTQCPPMPT